MLTFYSRAKKWAKGRLNPTGERDTITVVLTVMTWGACAVVVVLGLIRMLIVPLW